MFNKSDVQTVHEALQAAVGGSLNEWPGDRLAEVAAALARFAETPPADVAARRLDPLAFSVACAAVRTLNAAVGATRLGRCHWSRGALN